MVYFMIQINGLDLMKMAVLIDGIIITNKVSLNTIKFLI